MLNTPLLFIIFNRPDATKLVFEVIRSAKPKQLYVAADGPRPGKGEETKCAEARKIALQIDWDCEVKTLFRDHNLGCGLAVSEAITWFFDQVEEGIILEDDCLPDQSFFLFCEELLKMYRFDARVFQISACNFQLGKWRGDGDYYFSRLPQMWGWASWKRAWKYYEYNILYDKDVVNRTFAGNRLKKVRDEWLKVFDEFNAGKVDTWDYQWMYCCFRHNALVAVPNKNLVYNLGFREDATHTNFIPSYYAKIKLEALGPVIHHPSLISICEKADVYEQKIREGRIPKWRSFLSRLKRKIIAT